MNILGHVGFLKVEVLLVKASTCERDAGFGRLVRLEQVSLSWHSSESCLVVSF